MNKQWRRITLVAGVFVAGCGGLATAPVKVTEVHPPGSVAAAGRAAGGGGAAAVASVAAPSFKAGQQWTFRRVDLWRNEPVERFREEMLFADAGSWLVRWTIFDSQDATRLGSVTGERIDLASHGFADARVTQGRHEPLRFPLHVGKQWNFAYTLHGKSGQQLRIEQVATVSGWETVIVPAGSFHALKVVHKGRYATTTGYIWTGGIEETYWYAPSAQRVVKVEYRDTQFDGSTWDKWRDELVEMKL